MARDGAWLDAEADKYYDKLGLKCATREEFKRWFKAAQKCYTAGPKTSNEPFRTGRRLRSFCNDCLPEFEQEMTACNRCVKVPAKPIMPRS